MPDKYEHLVRYYGYYSNRSRGARKHTEQQGKSLSPIIIDDPPVDARRKANWARLIQKVYEVAPLECPICGATMRIIALIDDADVVERILKHLQGVGPRTGPNCANRARSALAGRPNPTADPITRAEYRLSDVSEAGVRLGDDEIAKIRLPSNVRTENCRKTAPLPDDSRRILATSSLAARIRGYSDTRLATPTR